MYGNKSAFVVCAPFLHAGWSHLVGNMVPLAALSVMLLIRLGATHSPVWRPYVGLLAAMGALSLGSKLVSNYLDALRLWQLIANSQCNNV